MVRKADKKLEIRVYKIIKLKINFSKITYTEQTFWVDIAQYSNDKKI